MLASTIGGVPAAAASAPPPSRWEALRRDDLRVAAVTDRLSRANSLFCRAALVPQLGFVLHSIGQYAPDERDAAARSFGLGTRIGVMAVVPNSPASAAGLRAGDQLVSVNGLALDAADPMGAPTNASVLAARQTIVAEMNRRPVSLRVTGPGGDRAVRFAAETGCAANVELAPGSIVNAWADGQVVVVSAGLLARCATDDDLAMVIAHEMSHNLLHHSARLARAGITRNGLLEGDGAGSAEMRRTEEEADGLAVRLAMGAGFDLDHAGTFMSTLLVDRGPDRSASTHPAPARRLALLAAAIAAAQRDQRALGAR